MPDEQTHSMKRVVGFSWISCAAVLCATILATVLATVIGCQPRVLGGPGGGGDGGAMTFCSAACVNCDPTSGLCQDCVPGQPACAGGAVVTCNDDGSYGDTQKICDTMNGEQCTNGDCYSACEGAASTHSYIGCDYYAVTTLTSELNPYFDFAVAVANPASTTEGMLGPSAQVTITRGSHLVDQRAVVSGTVEIFLLPWVAALSQNPDCSFGACQQVSEVSALVSDGAYHIVSSLPVTVYQFSPLEFEKPATASCQDPTPSTNCHSFSNDASILLPTTALQDEYYAIARQTMTLSGTAIPGFIALYGTVDGTQVTITSSAHTEAGMGVTALSPGQTVTRTLNAGEVLQVVSAHATGPCVSTSSDMDGTYCDLGPNYDLTGTHILADHPVGLFGGHACSFVPYNKWACDHLEEQITPLGTWGQHVLAVETKPQIKNEPNVWRIISGSDANAITFDPPATHAPVTLAAGAYIEFTAQGGFAVSASGRVAVGQYMVGEDYVDFTSIEVGDPSLGLGVPVEQYRSDYDFLSPSTYTDNYLTIIAPAGTGLTLDGVAVNTPWKSIGGSGYNYAYLNLSSGAHTVHGDAPFGITVSGVGNFTSYLYGGGQNLNSVPIQ